MRHEKLPTLGRACFVCLHFSNDPVCVRSGRKRQCKVFLGMAICSLRFQKRFVTSADGLFKITEILIGCGCWGLLYIGDVMSTSNDIPQVNKETLALTITTLSIWLITCGTFLCLLFTQASKLFFKLDCIFNAIFSIAYAIAAGYGAYSRHFVWLCISNEDKSLLNDKSCDEPLVSVYRNGGQNFAIVILGAVISAIYFMHWIYVCVKLCMNPVLDDKNFSLAEMQPMVSTVAH